MVCTWLRKRDVHSFLPLHVWRGGGTEGRTTHYPIGGLLAVAMH